MRREWIVVLVTLGLGLFGPHRHATCGEPLDNRIGRRVAPIFLLTRSDVQADLKLAPDQIAEANRLSTELHRRAQVLQGLTGERNVPAVKEARRAIDDQQADWLSKSLSDHQLERLGQLDLQWEGAAAMISRPLVTEYLNLTPDQVQKVTEYVKESRQRQAPANWTAADHFNLTRRAIALLSDKQRDQWIHLLGPKCPFMVATQKPAIPTAPRTAQGTGSQPLPTR